MQVSKPCNRQPHLLSVSRGVRSRPQKEDAKLTKVDTTVPLLTPTMETEMLKEPWVFPQPKANTSKEKDNAALSIWEENFQDLSGWCMDTFQGQCDFHIGESTNFKVSGTKYEGNGVLSSEEGIFKDLSSVTDEEKWSIRMQSTAGMQNRSSESCRGVESTSEAAPRFIKENTTTNTVISNSWEKLSKGAATNTNTPLWNRQNGTDFNTAFQTKYSVQDIDLDEACPASFDPSENQRDTWDMLRTVETTGSDTFDLLSYLCDDDMRSPEGSMSTDSSTISRVHSATDPPQVDTSSVRVKMETDEIPRVRKETRTTSTVTSTTAETTPSVSLTRRMERKRTATASKVVEDTYLRTRRDKPGEKCYVESDSDDQLSVSHYRESREKNNEASRKSRMNKKAKETEMAMRATELERDNRILKMKVEELEKLVTSMRSALLRSALKKEF